MGDAGGQPALSVLIPAVPKHALLFKISPWRLETKITDQPPTAGRANISWELAVWDGLAGLCCEC